MLIVSILFGAEILIFIISTFVGLVGLIGFAIREEKRTDTEDERAFIVMFLCGIISLISFTAMCGTIYYTATEIAELSSHHHNCF